MKRDHKIAGEPTYECLWPLGCTAASTIEPALRIGNLAGKTVAEIWNFQFQGDIMFAGIREELSKRFPGVKFVGYDTFGSTNGPKRNEIFASMPTLLREHAVDAVISGIGA